MASKSETLADIVAEMREKATHFEKNSELMVSENAIALFVFPYADRIEAAAKREKAEWESAACSCVSDAVISGRVAVEHVPVGNAAAMYAALVKIHDKVNSLDEECGVDPVEIRDIARAAISKPARQCDVGTPDEQYRRWVHFCEQRLHRCDNCEINSPVGCTFKFGDMPYEAEEGGAE